MRALMSSRAASIPVLSVGFDDRTGPIQEACVGAGLCPRPFFPGAMDVL